MRFVNLFTGTIAMGILKGKFKIVPRGAKISISPIAKF